MRVEILTDPAAVDRGRKIIDAMIAAAPVPITIGTSYVGSSDVLMMYGNGHPMRRKWWMQHLARGGRCVGWDLGYWRRKEDGTCRMRLTIDADHCQRMLRPEPPERWDDEGIALRHDGNVMGPILLVGMGRKAQGVHGLPAQTWEKNALRRIREAYPGKEVIFKPKRVHDRPLAGVETTHGLIHQVLRNTSLVVCRHSNVAVDACIAGVPVVCEDGAAAALYGSDLAKPVAPRLDARLGFLRSLAWWQWKPEEAAQAWSYILTRLSEPRCN